MFEKRLIYIVQGLLYILMSMSLEAMPAYPNLTKVLTSNGFVNILLKGDENQKWALTTDGNLIVNTPEGWYYASYDGNEFHQSKFELCEKNSRSEELKEYLLKQKVNTNHSVSYSTSTSFRKSRNNGATKSIKGDRRILVVLMQFPDKSFSKEQSDFVDLFNQINYSFDGAKGSVHDYYNTVSWGQLNLYSVIIGPFTSKHEMSFYGKNIGLGGNDSNPFGLFEEALEEASKTMDLSQFDCDNDGIIDNFHIIYAGYGEESGASSDAIWSHEMSFPDLSIQDLTINRYSCAPELRGNTGSGITRIGPHCHEIGHALGAMDYYDTDYTSGGQYQGTGKWDVMASGSWNEEGVRPANFNPYVKTYDFGWTREITLDKDTNLIVEPMSRNNFVYRINTPQENEFFLLENINDIQSNLMMPGTGLMIYHIGPQLELKSNTNKINATFPQQCYPVCASSNYSIPFNDNSSYGDINSSGCPYPGASQNPSFTVETTPASLLQNGESAEFSIIDIIEKEDLSVSFKFLIEDYQVAPELPLTGKIVWQDSFNEWMLSSDWHQQSITSGAKWTIGKTFDDDIHSSFAKLDYVQTFTIGDSEPSRASLFCNPTLLDSITDYILSFSYASIGSNNHKIDSIIVRIRSLNEDEWRIISNYEIRQAGMWFTKNLIIPNEMVPIELCFDGVVNKSSIVKLDDVSIRVYANEDSGIIPNLHFSDHNVFALKGGIFFCPKHMPNRIEIYSMPSGMLFYSKSNVQNDEFFSVPSGLYLIITDCGNQKFVIP